MKFSIVIISMLLLSGCSWFKPDTIYVPLDPINTCIQPPEASQILLEDVQFKVVIDELGIVWVATSSIGYEKLSKNMQEILRHLKEKNAVIEYYEECNKPKEEEDVSP